MGDADPRSTVP